MSVKKKTKRARKLSLQDEEKASLMLSLQTLSKRGSPDVYSALRLGPEEQG
jgi:hypothetical protein